ncbi:beta-ketoacyl synthase N-terminal-like domain-containing protein [Micromonospora sp. NPDC007271]|uniref:type I polyketide synthase n=1 Tax=Micromonospora sp. NPDC007271 TaxID=3154587 RepID=UPI0033E16274
MRRIGNTSRRRSSRTPPVDVAIVGIGCRFPGGVTDLDSLWRVLSQGREVTGPVPPDRPGADLLATAGVGGFLPDIDRFDNEFFGVAPREARELDPQQRLLLELSWRAMEHSGVGRPTWAGSRTGVYFGILAMDYAVLHARTLGVSAVNGHYASGKEFSFAAGRVAYTFGLHGPCMTLTAACASSLLAVHLAARALAAGDCDAALAGGVNLMLGPELSLYMRQIRAISPSARCRPFDAAADGVVRGEGGAVLVLKRYADAVADGDLIWGVIKGGAANHDGRSAGLTAPNAVAQEMLLREALDDAGVEPADVHYVEAHSTGTPLGDPIELSALAAVFGPGRDPATPLPIGSHKANFGHLDSAAGVLGLLKALLVAREGLVPPQIKLDHPTPRFDWAGSGLVVPTAPMPLGVERPLVGVNAFGLSGSNVHVVLTVPDGRPEPAGPARARVRVTAPAASPPVAEPVLLVSGPTPQSLRRQAEAYGGLLRTARPEALEDLLYSAAARRTHHAHRLALTGAGAGPLADALDRYLAGDPAPGTAAGERFDDSPAFLVQVFSGQGAQYPAMGVDLYRSSPVVRATLDECAEAIRDLAGWSLLDELSRVEGSRLVETRIAQPAIFALQLGLARLWRSWGVRPDAVVGHSMGEVTAACVAGVLSLDEAVRMILLRGEVLQGAAGTGGMAAVELSPDEVEPVLARHGPAVVVAAVNGPHSVVLAGGADALRRVAAALAADGVGCVPLAGGYAFHSPAVEPHAAQFAEQLGEVVPRAGEVPLLSTVDAEDQPRMDTGYWARNVRETVRFWPAVDRLLDRRPAVFLELGPHPVLPRPIEAAIAQRERPGAAVGSLVRGRPAGTALAHALARLHVAGVAVDWPAVRGTHRYLPLPPVELAGERYWLTPGPPPAESAAGNGRPPITGAAGARPAPGDAATGGGPEAADPADVSGSPDTAADRGFPHPAGADGFAHPAALGGGLRAEVRLFDAAGRLVHTFTGLGGLPDEEAASRPQAGAERSDPGHQLGTAVGDQTGPVGRAPGASVSRREAVAVAVTAAAAEALGYGPGRRLARGRGFFDLGMDSLALIGFLNRLQRELAVPIDPSAGIEYPTIDALTDHLLGLLPAPTAQPPVESAPPPGEPADPPVEPAGPPAAARTEPAPPAGVVPPAVAGTVGPAQPTGLPDRPRAARSPTSDDDRSADGVEPIAIVGIGCRLPGADSVAAFWRLLRDGVDATSEVPVDRWDAAALLGDPTSVPGTVVTRRGAFLDRVDLFDNAFFRISAREARAMDPQQRLFLEVAWEALEDAGLDVARLHTAPVGLFVGMNTTDYQQLLTHDPGRIDLYYGTGNSFSGAPGRLSYFLNLRGPSIAVDTACSSSLVAVHLACQSLRAGESSAALAGGVNVMAAPTVHQAMSAAGALAPDGRCKTFDAAADGYGRGEGAGVVVLKTLTRARLDGDRIYAVIRGSAVNHNGASGGLTVPSTAAQRELIASALEMAAVAPSDVDYLEAHGTGTRLGDAAELRAIAAALGGDRPPDRPLLVGSVKTNIGHLEAAAGVAGLVKTALGLWHGEIPPHLHLSRPTDQVPWDRLPVRVTTTRTPWPARADRAAAGGDRPAVAGVSAFGFTGTNAHVVLAGPGPATEVTGFGTARAGAAQPAPAGGHLLLVSAAAPAALDAARDLFRARVAETPPDQLADLCFSSAARRTHLEHRLAVVGRTRDELLAALAGERPAHRGTVPPGRPPRLVLAFGHHAAVDIDLLARREPAVRAALDRLDAATGGAARARLAAGRPARDDPGALLVTQVALAALWAGYGVVPDAVFAAGAGELAAACAAGLVEPARALAAALDGSAAELVAAAGLPPGSTPGGNPGDPGVAPAGEWSVWGAAAPPLRLASVDGPAALTGAEADLLLAADGRADAAAFGLAPEATVPVVSADPQRADGFLDAIAALHVQGVPIRWSAVYGARPYRIVPPSYPWQRRRHWPEDPVPPPHREPAVPSGAAGPHPHLDAPFRPVDDAGRRYYPVRVDPGAADPGSAEVTAPALVELLLAAAGDVLGAGAALRDVELPWPALPASRFGPDAEAQLVAEPDGAGWRLRLLAGAEVATAVARTEPGPVSGTEPGPALTSPMPIGPMPTGPTHTGPTPIGPAETRLGAAATVTGTAAAGTEVTLPAEPAGFPLAAAIRFAAGRLAPTAEGVVLCGADRIRVGPGTGPAVVRAAAGGPDTATLRVATAEGTDWAALDGLRFVPAERATLAAEVRDRCAGRLFTVTWRRVEPAGPGPAGDWLVCPAGAGARPVADRLATQLRHAGADVQWWEPAGEAGWSDLPGERNVLLVTADPDGAADPAAPARAVLLATRALRSRAGGPGRLWVVTAGAVEPAAGVPRPAQAGVWALGRVLALEAAAVWGGLLDLDPRALADDAAVREAVRVLPAPGRPRPVPVEDELCRRGETWWAPRLSPLGPLPAAARVAVCRPRLWYAVTDALLPANRPFLDVLVERGLRRLVAVATTSGGMDADAAERLAELTRCGVEVRQVPLDHPDLAGELAARSLGGGLGGAVLLAPPAPIRSLDDTDPAVVAAELGWAGVVRRMVEAIRGRRPELVVVTGSAAVTWGASGTAARAVAEGVVTAAMAAVGRIPRLVRLMPRSDTGELSRRDDMVMTESGLRPLPDPEVAEAFDAVLRAGVPGEVTVAAADVTRYARVCRTLVDRAFLAELAGSADGPAGGTGTAAQRATPVLPPVAARILAAPAERREEILLDLVLGAVLEVLGEASDADVGAERGFFDLGMDSVMTLSLRGRLEQALGVALPATLTFEFPNAAALTHHLRTELESAPAGDGPGEPAGRPPAPTRGPGAPAATARAAGVGRPGAAPPTTAPPAAVASWDAVHDDDLDGLSEDALMDRLLAAMAEDG